MITARQHLAARLGRLYPFTPGCDRFAHGRAMRLLTGGQLAGNRWTQLRGGQHIEVPLQDYIGRAVYLTGNFDRQLDLIVRKILRLGDCVLDIGANLGVVTLQCAHLVGVNGSVGSFEPNPRTFQFLEKSVSRNGFENVRLHPFALGPTEGTATLMFPEENFGMATLNGTYADGSKRGVEVQVPVKTLDGFIRTKKIGPVRLLKIDVEGFEMQVFLGGQDWLTQSPPDVILFESNRPKASDAVDPVCAFLLQHGYDLFSIAWRPFSVPLRPITGVGREQTHDVVAIHKSRPETRALFRVLQ